MKALNNVAGSLALAVFILVAPQPSPAQDLRGEIDGIIKDYLVTHPDEVGEIVKDYMIKHPEAVGQIIAELLKHRPAASTSAGATGAASAKTAARSKRRDRQQRIRIIFVAAPGYARQSKRRRHAG